MRRKNYCILSHKDYLEQITENKATSGLHLPEKTEQMLIALSTRGELQETRIVIGMRKMLRFATEDYSLNEWMLCCCSNRNNLIYL